MAKKDDFYIAMLKYGRDAMKKSEMVIYDDFKEHMDDIHPNFMPEKAFKLCFSGYFDPLSNFGGGTSTLDNPDISYVIKNEAYFQLLEHEELQEARTASKQALKRSTIAIVIAIFTAVFSIGVQLYQISTPGDVIISEGQVKRMVASSSAPRQMILDPSQLEKLLKSSDGPKNVLIDAGQFEQLIKRFERLIKQTSRSDGASQ